MERDARILPFNALVFHEDREEISVVSQPDGGHYPEDGVTVKARERFCIFVLRT